VFTWALSLVELSRDKHAPDVELAFFGRGQRSLGCPPLAGRSAASGDIVAIPAVCSRGTWLLVPVPCFFFGKPQDSTSGWPPTALRFGHVTMYLLPRIDLPAPSNLLGKPLMLHALARSRSTALQALHPGTWLKSRLKFCPNPQFRLINHRQAAPSSMLSLIRPRIQSATTASPWRACRVQFASRTPSVSFFFWLQSLSCRSDGPNSSRATEWVAHPLFFFFWFF